MSKERYILILEAELKDDIVQQLMTLPADEVEPEIKWAIEEFLLKLENGEAGPEYDNIEIYQVGSYFIVTDKCIFIAEYEDEVEDIEEKMKPNKNK